MVIYIIVSGIFNCYLDIGYKIQETATIQEMSVPLYLPYGLTYFRWEIILIL